MYMWMTDKHTVMQVIYMMDTQTGIQTHVLGLTQSADVLSEEGKCNSNNNYGLKA